MKPKKLIGIWIDSSKAVLVTIEGNNETVSVMQSGIETQQRIEGEGGQPGRFGNQYLENEKAKEHKIGEMESSFLDRVMKRVASGDQLYVFGPAHMKSKFEKAFVRKGSPKPNLRAIESADSMTDNQVAAKVRDFFGKSAGPAF